jgi:hypothetical protein
MSPVTAAMKAGKDQAWSNDEKSKVNTLGF